VQFYQEPVLLSEASSEKILTWNGAENGRRFLGYLTKLDRPVYDIKVDRSV